MGGFGACDLDGWKVNHRSLEAPRKFALGEVDKVLHIFVSVFTKKGVKMFIPGLGERCEVIEFGV